jgi:hypothetical protein
LRYQQTTRAVVTAARNLASIWRAGDIVAFTAMIVASSRIGSMTMTAVFEADPEVAVMCGRVHVARRAARKGLRRELRAEIREWKDRYPPFGRDWGITANLALPAPITTSVGKFDPMLGAGAPLRSGGEPDLLFCVLRAGLRDRERPRMLGRAPGRAGPRR